MTEEETTPAPAPVASAPVPRASPPQLKPKDGPPADIPREGGDFCPLAVYDSAKGCNVHYDSAGNAVEHGVPEGYAFNDNGELEPEPPAGERK